MSRQRTIKSYAPLALILLIATSLRLYGLGASSLWTDEARVALHSLRPPTEILSRWPGGVEPPLSYLIQHLILRFSDAEAVLRLPAVAASLLTIWFTFRLGDFLFSRRAGLLAAACLSISPLDIRYAQEARYYTLFAAGFLFATVSFFRLLKGQRAARGYLAGFVLLSLTNIFATAVWMAHALTWAFLALVARSHWRGRGSFIRLENSASKRAVTFLVLLLILLALLYAPGVWSRLQEPAPAATTTPPSPMKMGAGDASAGVSLSTWFWDIYYRTSKWFAIPTGLADNRSMTLLGIPAGYQWPLRICGLLLAVALLATRKRHRGKPWLLAFQLLFLITLLALVTERFGPSIGILAFGVRRLLFLLPLFWLLIALGCEAVGESVAKWARSPAAASVLAWCIALLLGGAIALSILPGYYRWRKDDWRAAAAYLRSNVPPTQPILCCTSWQTDPTFEWAPLSFYLRDTPIRNQLVYVKGQNRATSFDQPVWWEVSYGEPSDPPPGVHVTRQTFIGPYWIWIERLETTAPSSEERASASRGQ